MIEKQHGKNEISVTLNALYIFTSQMRKLLEFAGNVAKNNFDVQAAMFDGKGAIAKALIDMRDNLRDTYQQENERKWLTQGVAEFGNTVRRYDDQRKLYDQMLSFIIKYTSASLGALFVSDMQHKIGLCACIDKKLRSFGKHGKYMRTRAGCIKRNFNGCLNSS